MKRVDSTLKAPAVLGLVPRTGLFERLSAGRAVTLVSAPPGSGKTVLLRSWIEDAGLRDRVAWVSVERGERDPQRFWLSVLEVLRAAVRGEAFVEKLAPAPEFDGEAVVGRLVAELGPLEEPVVLVIDDLHELHSSEALAQLELLLARLPPLLRVVLATRHDPQLRLHGLRLEGKLTELRTAELRFTLEETRALLAASGIVLSDEAVALLHERTEGWAAGLRLAALSLAGHPDPEQFVAEFSGSERTVADYLFAEVLARQPDDVRRLLLRTSVLERIDGALADRLVGDVGSERILQALEDGGAFVVSLDASRTWFRYHHLFADLLRLELRRTDPDAVAGLHRAASRWLAEHGHVVDAVRHAQAARDWGGAARLLADHSFSLSLDGQEATVGALLAAFPADAVSDPELTAVFAADQLARGSLDDAAAYIELAERNASAVPEERRRRFEVALEVARLSLARRRGDFGTVLGEVESLHGPADAETLSDVALGNDVSAVALMNLGIVELWSVRMDDAERHLEQALELARRIGRPYPEIGSLSHLAIVAGRRSFALVRERCDEAIAIAEAQGWGSEPIAGLALAARGGTDVWHGRFGEAEQWLDRAERALRPDAEPATGLLLHLTRGMLHVGQGRLQQALAAFRAAERLQALLVAPHWLTVQVHQFLVHTLVRLGDTEGARATLAGMSEEHRDWGEARAALASVNLAESDPQAAVDALAPVVDGSAPVVHTFSVIQALLLDALARDELRESQAAESGIERALVLAEPDALIFPFVLTPPRDLLERHPRHGTAHAALLQDILDVLAGTSLPAGAGEPQELREELSDGELRVLRYLPSNLSAPEIGKELYLSLNTVKTHMRHIYAKLGVHRRTEAVERARELGLLGPSSRRR
jgi:LuxR family transcriptional regulator, maltose regulon positive regulatory protein